jgi:hypothetical protein
VTVASLDGSWYRSMNEFARDTGWAHGVLANYANWAGLALSALPLVAGSLLGRRRPKRRSGRSACPTRRRRTSRGELRPHTTLPPRPRRQPPTQLRPPPHRDHPGTRPPAGTRLPQTKKAEGKSNREAIRCLERQLARTIYTTLKNVPLLT